ncbi:MAG: hypothetical protein ACT4PT_01125 [Methanobacteriota archaeon]
MVGLLGLTLAAVFVAAAHPAAAAMTAEQQSKSYCRWDGNTRTCDWGYRYCETRWDGDYGRWRTQCYRERCWYEGSQQKCAFYKDHDSLWYESCGSSASGEIDPATGLPSPPAPEQIIAEIDAFQGDGLVGFEERDGPPPEP